MTHTFLPFPPPEMSIATKNNNKTLQCKNALKQHDASIKSRIKQDAQTRKRVICLLCGYGDISHLVTAYTSWARLCPQSNTSVLERLPASTRRKDRCSVVLDPIQWLWAASGWVFLEVVSSLMEACESQQQLHGDGLHQEHCMGYGQRISSIIPLPCWKQRNT